MKEFNKIIMSLQLIGLTGFIVLISACASTPKTQTHYFVLDPSSNFGQQYEENQSSSTRTSTSRTIESEHPIALQPIQLAKFLDQPGIVLQTNHHEIEVAHYHRWAEPLKKNLHRYITQSLGIDNSNETTQMLEIQFHQFQGTHEGNALISGYWKINHVSQPFSYQAPLTKPGYTELVTQLALLLDQLCTDISNQLSK
jgi:uncharacterized lipoprotein YmbA